MFTREELMERIIDAVTPAIKTASKDISQKLGTMPDKKIKAKVPFKDVESITRKDRGTTPIGRYGKAAGFSSPVEVKAAAHIGKDNPALDDTGSTLYGFVRKGKKKGEQELTLSKEYFNFAKDEPGARSGLQHSVAHELIHSQDPHIIKTAEKDQKKMAKYDNHPRKDELKAVNYFSSPGEVKAYGATIGHYGGRDFKYAKTSRKAAMKNVAAKVPMGIFGPVSPDNTPDTITHRGTMMVRGLQQHIGNRDYIAGLPSHMRRRAHKGHHQFHKALYQGVEQAYPQKAKKPFKSGMARALTKPRLPESREELIAWIVEVSI